MSHTLLLADDSVTIQRVIELTFADEDVHVVAVSDGDRAISLLDESPPDIVLADIGMPNTSGYDVAQHIRNTPRLAHIPVVLLAGAFEPVDQERATAVGCDGVLAKPFEPQAVVARVRELLGRPKPAPIPEFVAAAAVEPSPMVSLSTSPVEPALSSGAAAKHGDIDDYFNRLDEAFAKLGDAPPARETPEPEALSAVTASIDWFAAPGPQDSRDPELRLSPALEPDAPIGTLVGGSAIQPPAEMPWGEPSEQHAATLANVTAEAPAPLPPAPAPLPPAAPLSPSWPELPPLADAFAALLAAEQSSPATLTRPLWPAATAQGAGTVGVTRELVDRVAREVLDRLTDRVVRETVADIVSDVAERLVREEIARIKAHL